MARYLNAKQILYACNTLLRPSRMGLLVKARRVWLAHAPSKVTEGEMNHRRAWEALLPARVRGVTGCPRRLLKATFDSAVGRDDLGSAYQLVTMCGGRRSSHAVRSSSS